MQLSKAMHLAMSYAHDHAQEMRSKTNSPENDIKAVLMPEDLLCGIERLLALCDKLNLDANENREIKRCKSFIYASEFAGKKQFRKILPGLKENKDRKDANDIIEITKNRVAIKNDQDSVTTIDVLVTLKNLYGESPEDIGAGTNTALHGNAGGVTLSTFSHSMDYDSRIRAHAVHELITTDRKAIELRNYLLSMVKGQDHAIHAFAKAIFSGNLNRSLVNVNKKKPKAVLLFAGSPGVGKTFIAEEGAMFLNLPFKRFDMSSFTNYDQGVTTLAGVDKSYKSARAGTLTSFVKENPSCVLLFDEIEKANPGVIQLFLQVLDAGVMYDNYLDKNVYFNETIIIFTTNAGRSLYENSEGAFASYLSENVIIDALATDINPRTNQPYFPMAICSRLSSGSVVMFNHLEAHHLLSIIDFELNRFTKGFYSKYGIKLRFSKGIAHSLMLRYSSSADARVMSAKARAFPAEELYKLFRLWNSTSLDSSLTMIKEIFFSAAEHDMTKEVRELFEWSGPLKMLVISSDSIFEQLPVFDESDNIMLVHACDENKIFELLASQEISCVLLDPLAVRAPGGKDADKHKNRKLFDRIPWGASILKNGNALFKKMRERLPELPVYIFETGAMKLDRELMLAYTMEGARDKITFCADEPAVMREELKSTAANVYAQKTITKLVSGQKILDYDTVPSISDDNTLLNVRLKNMELVQTVKAGDSGYILDAAEIPDTRFDDIIGADNVKDEMKSFIEYLRDPKKMRASGMKPPGGILMYGPPGTGKTMLARAMAGEADVAFIPASAGSFVKQYVGTGPESVRKLFESARRYAPSIIFIDEIDAIGINRESSSHSSSHEYGVTLNMLLTEMCGFDKSDKRPPVIVMAATNFQLESLDHAMLRRFDRHIFVDLPNTEERAGYLRREIKRIPEAHISDDAIEQLAKRSNGMSLARLETVIALASRNAIKKGMPLDYAILEDALNTERFGEQKDSDSIENVERTARHETGHAVVSYELRKMPLYLSAIPRGGMDGHLEMEYDESKSQFTRGEMLETVSILLAGRAAEVLYYEDGFGTGASSDLKKATDIVMGMIKKYGMSEEFGLVVFDEKSSAGVLSEKIVAEARKILDERYEIARKIIKDRRKAFDNLVKLLVEKRKLDAEEIKAVLEKHE